MSKKTIPKYKVIKDTREQNGWFFSEYDKCAGMEIGTLHTGDYTMKGYEDIVCIERKASVSEVAMNLGRKKGPFQAEMERMKDFEFSFLIFEFSMSDLINYPISLLESEEDKEIYSRYKAGEIKLPKYKRFQVVEQTRIKGRYLLKSLIEFQIWYNTKVLFCDNKRDAFLVCNSIFKRLNELFNGGKYDNI